ncbi:hypothetical protein [uncultured Sulfitobacter sp.]|uniref:hypothetical protein n=1 Tax=uncultured Sulfitobacter sp. TaxID=191468 RepID=UPI0026019A1E|nr:hypothetical protein [uncultured Sulfitobacter sp.]
MISAIVNKARAKAEHTAGTAAIGLGASLALGVGLAFWTGAGWLYLITVTTPLNAAMILGALYTGAGCIGFAVVATRRQAPITKEPVVETSPTFDNIMSAFMSGVTAGARTRS